jgi:disulfide bond formation protein DsbB
MKNISHRMGNVIGFAACASMLAYALYAQHQLGLEPCPLCVFQRMALIVLSIVFLAALIQNPVDWGRRVYSLLILAVAGGGASVSARHVWLQNLPADAVPACGPGYDYIMGAFPLLKALDVIFSGSGECAEIHWLFLGLSMPSWVLIMFTTLGIFGTWWNFSRSRS